MQIFIEFNDRYEQAGTYHNLGMVAQMQRKFQQARDFFLHALEIFVAQGVDYDRSIVLRRLARLWKASGDTTLPTIIAPLLNSTPTEAEEILRSMLEKNSEELNSEHFTEG